MADPVTAPTALGANTAPGALAAATPAATAPVGLINAAPGNITTAPGTIPTGNTGPGAPVTSYAPDTATAASAAVNGYNPNAFTVTPNQTVASQLQGIIASGSPLMQQAIANANQQMNQRGLLNSSQAITAGENAVIGAATPIATADANTYAQAATNTANAQNTALASQASAENTAALQNSAQRTSTSQFNAGQTNAALSQAAAASTSEAQTAQSIAGTLANTGLQTASAQTVQNLQNQGNLANIMANGRINTEITQLTNDNNNLLKTSTGAASIYQQALANLSAITTNPNLSEAQKTTALNDGVAQLNDALSVMTQIAGMPDVASTLNFSATGTAPTGAVTSATPAVGATASVGGASYTFDGTDWNGTDANGNVQSLTPAQFATLQTGA